ncbi:MAG: hypothetical protein HYV28_05925 [Ignavibacteriales bacterium]|nr:hypothetical protein [Ignavibacteriales bacterium]
MKGLNNNDKLGFNAVYNEKVFKSENLKTTTIGEIFNEIKTSESLKKHTNILRAIEDDEEQKKYKVQNLPFFNLGTFNNGHRKNVNLLGSSFLLFDYDHLDEELNELKARLQNDEYVFAYFVSPRGNGLKVIYKLDKEITDYNFFSQLYKFYAAQFKIDLGAEPDTTSDASRPCFFSYDPELYFNAESKTLSTDIICPVTTNTKIGGRIDFTYSPVDSVMLRGAVDCLRKQKLTYNEWLACGFALAPLGEYGRQYFHLMSDDNPNFKDTYADVESKFNNLLADTDKYNDIDTLYLIAANYGYEPFAFAKTEVPAKVGAVPFDKELEEQFLLDDTRDPNKLLGFPLTKFKELAGHVDGLQPGFYLLGAESNVGKTAVLTNMTLDILETNPDATVMYFSLDDSRIYTAKRFLGIMTGLGLNDTSKQQTDPAKAKLLQSSRTKLLNLIRSGRLIVHDTADVNSIEHLRTVIESIADKSKLVVFIDGLYNLEVVDKFRGGIREENIERARQVKLLVDMYRLPILTTGELRKKTKEEGKDKAPTMHDLMETGKFAYNANVVWMLYGKTEDLRSDEPTLTLEYVKNKLSDYKGIQYLTFKRATGTMTEVPIIQLAQPPAGPLFSDGGGHA